MDSTHHVDPQLMAQIQGLIELRRSKSEKLEAIYSKGKRQADEQGQRVQELDQAHIETKRRVDTQLQQLQQANLSQSLSIDDMHRWFHEEKQQHRYVSEAKLAHQQSKQQWSQMKHINAQQKDEYQQSIRNCEKIALLKENLLGE